MWRKNRSANEKCAGVDLNRNFDIGFNDTSRNGCSNSYGGPEPESEIETVTMIQLLSSNQQRIKATLFIHSFSQLWLSPYGYQTASLPADYSEMVPISITNWRQSSEQLYLLLLLFRFTGKSHVQSRLGWAYFVLTVYTKMNLNSLF